MERKIIVLDDDPTGVQTVHNVPVYTGWDRESVLSGFQEKGSMFFILTNSRSFTEERTAAVHREIAETVSQISLERKQEFLIICRGDSTLRGHYLLEPDILADCLKEQTGIPVDGVIICPCFFEGGRVTSGDIHYVREGESLIPAAETEFARDRTFGFTQSHMGEYIEEKTAGRTRAEDCGYIEIEDLESGNTEKIRSILMGARDGKKIIVNSLNYIQLNVFCEVFLETLAAGKQMIVRSAASFVKSVGRFSYQPLLEGRSLRSPGNHNGGIILIGSHVAKTTLQLEALKQSGASVCYIEFCTGTALISGGLEKEADRCLKETEKNLVLGQSVAVYTSRMVLTPDGMGQEEILKLSVRISEALTSIVGQLTVEPSFIIAKGGITSSDVGTKALNVKRAVVRGQIRPGIPVWITGEESKFPQSPFIIFPGNAGTEYDLRDIVEEISTSAARRK